MFRAFGKFLKSLFDASRSADELSSEDRVIEVGAVAKSLEITPELEEKSWKILAEEFPKHMAVCLSEFPRIDCKQFCTKATENALAGYRADRLASIIETEFNVPAAKAESLAAISGSVYMTLFRRLKHMEAGVTRFIWRTSGDQRVCAACAKLDGKTFTYSDPPVVHCCGRDVWTDEYCGCRCIEEPVLDPID
ncbi:MAG: phage minor head protein [Chloroflexota bacterium]